MSVTEIDADPVAYMTQHDETGIIGFVDPWQIKNRWEKHNPRQKVICPLYRFSASLQMASSMHQERFQQLEEFIKRLLNPDEFGHSVTQEVRDEARRLLKIGNQSEQK